MNATDPDGSSDLLRYRLASGSAVDWFNMDEVTGIIRVARGGDLEWEQDSALHTLSVVAVDQGDPWPQTSTTTLTVQVEDVNDKPPRFTKQLFVHHVAEVTPVGTQVPSILPSFHPSILPSFHPSILIAFITVLLYIIS